MSENRPIGSAPRDGRVIVVGADGSPEFLMAWSPTAENPVFAPGVIGMWEAPDLSFTWVPGEGGPQYWRPMDGCTMPLPAGSAPSTPPRLGRH